MWEEDGKHGNLSNIQSSFNKDEYFIARTFPGVAAELISLKKRKATLGTVFT